MRYLIDTDWVADWLNGQPGTVTTLTQLRAEGLAISIITYGEVYEGVYYGRQPQQAEQAFRQFLRGVSVLPLTRPTMRQFAGLRGELRRQGKMLPDADLLIAATALNYNLTLLTRNRAHFERVKNLSLYS